MDGACIIKPTNNRKYRKFVENMNELTTPIKYP
jgi:hypothetical protein